MLNKDYILSRIKTKVNSNNQVSYEVFEELFSGLTYEEQDSVLEILIDHGIDLTEDSQLIENNDPPVNNKSSNFINYKKLLNLTNEQLCIMAQEGVTAAKSALFYKNIGFMHVKANQASKRFIKSDMEVDDYIQEGFLGLLKGIEKFDVTKNTKFLTYAGFWIWQSMDRAGMDKGYLIRMPVHRFERIKKIHHFFSANFSLTQPQIIAKLIEEQPEYNETEILKLLAEGEAYLNTVSLNSLVGVDEDTELMDLYADTSIEAVEEQIFKLSLVDEINKILERLTDREREVVSMRFGLNSYEPHTLDEIGIKFNLTRERIRQIEAKAIRKLRNKKISGNLAAYLE